MAPGTIHRPDEPKRRLPILQHDREGEALMAPRATEHTRSRRRPPVVVVTGASAGVGRAVLRRFAELDHAQIGLIARGRKRLHEAAEEVRALGGEALALPADVADFDALERAAERVADEFGPIDIWINCAMATILAPFKEITPE